MDPILTRTAKRMILCSLLLFITALPAYAANKDPFSSGSMRASVLIGNGYAFNESYLVVGVGAGYFIANGLELGLDTEVWNGGPRDISKISPSVRYIVPSSGSAKPYVGVFYRRTMVQGLEDLDSVGARAGVYFLSNRGSYFGIGGVYEKYLSCNESVYLSCSDAYPEIILAIAF